MTDKIIRNYAKLLIGFLNRGQGPKPGDRIYVRGKECTRRLFLALNEVIAESGCIMLPMGFVPDEFDFFYGNRKFLELADDSQLENYYPKKFWDTVLETADHIITIHSVPVKNSLAQIPQEKMKKFGESISPFQYDLVQREDQRLNSYTVCLWPTQAMADAVGIPLVDYWEVVIDGCYLREEDPVAKWRGLQKEIHAAVHELNALEIDTIHVTGESVDLHITLGEMRQWIGLSGRNLPSTEIFTSPDCRYTNGWVKFDKALLIGTTKVSGIFLRFENGIVIESSAEENYEALEKILKAENGNKLGEFSFTDERHSQITRDIGEVLFVENMKGNFHIALGRAYPQAYSGKDAFNEATRAKYGFNWANVHTDIVFTGPFAVNATLKNGKKAPLYKNRRIQVIQ
jgi:aminopeptidase